MLMFVCVVPSPVFALDVSTVQNAIEQSGAKWEAGVPDKDNPMRLGLRPSVESHSEHSLQEMRLSAADFIPSRFDWTNVPSHFDWRDVDGKSYVTPVRNQGNCGSCWAFSIVGALESLALITLDTPSVDLDLSEQTLISCSTTGDCDGGFFDKAAEYIRKSGLPKEDCYPYNAYDTECGLICQGSFGFDSSYNVKNWVFISDNAVPDLNVLKSMLVTLGPLSVVIETYEDFNYYKSGIYSYTTGSPSGPHAVLLVGYDDREEYFIVKNSWGPTWGEAGYFRIAYSQVKNEVKFANSTVGLMGLAAPANRIFPVITGNGERCVTVEAGEQVKIAVSLNPVNQPKAEPVDWWIWRTGPDGTGTFGYDVNTRAWKEGLQPIKLSIFRLDPYLIWNGELSEGGYQFHFAIDDNDDGIFDGTWQGGLKVIQQ